MAEKGRLSGAALSLLLCKDNQELNSRLFGAFKCLRLNLEVEPCEISRKLFFSNKKNCSFILKTNLRRSLEKMFF